MGGENEQINAIAMVTWKASLTDTNRIFEFTDLFPSKTLEGYFSFVFLVEAVYRGGRGTLRN